MPGRPENGSVTAYEELTALFAAPAVRTIAFQPVLVTWFKDGS